MSHIVILGAGPAGHGAAYRLRKTNRADVTVVERSPVVGGLSGAFDISGQAADHGSHRLHPECLPDILADLRDLLGV
ncbi:MAG: FAD-dependent oxidoreductase [Chloroflexi bacterium]|nr:FAD-dependent oxidoreductase [Chloroflexota bacterium]